MDQSAFRGMLGRPRTGLSTSVPAPRPRNLITGEAGAKASFVYRRPAPAKEAAFKPRKLKDAPKLVSSDADRRDDKGALDEIAQLVDSLRSGRPASSSAPGAQDDLDASLEAAFETAAPAEPERVAGRKRTREDIVRELREKKAGSEGPHAGKLGDAAAAATKGAGKGFKPIGKSAPSGFKPIGEKKKKKKAKVVSDAAGALPMPEESHAKRLDGPKLATEPEPARLPEPPLPPPGPEVDMEEDIFAGAGVFEGYDVSSDEEGEAAEGSKPAPAGPAESLAAPPPGKANWFNESSRSPSPPPVARRAPTPPARPSASAAGEGEEGEEEGAEEDGEMRLRPLESSSIPSIRELLSLDREESARAKRRARKDAWRAKQGLGPSLRDGGEGGESEEEEEERRKKKKKRGVESELDRLQAYKK
ncbi:hypothetical protein CALCODRAFT_213532 [Calocera cornea HHB12733]|uniref:RED-like N-terminal domain-containing protein n=1 Tax=Calocera cornea HHB12733 TaxID=1353952 RepID=A0A165HAQ5_9BASI|nr:hypothetical protein CALCODRAFT_213532 [Calocera cornea HHB12733]